MITDEELKEIETNVNAAFKGMSQSGKPMILKLVEELRSRQEDLSKTREELQASEAANKRLRDEVRSYREALEFYADFERSKCVCPDGSFVAKMDVAREALATGLGEEKE